MTLRRYEHPGKFEGGLIIDEYVYAASLDGCGETVGSDDGGESYTSIDGPLLRDDTRLPNPADGELSADERTFLASQAGAIIYEGPQGFVYVTYYDDEESYLIAWNRLVDAYAIEYDDDEEEDDTDDEAEGPDDDALTTTDDVHFYQYGKLVLTVGEDEDRDVALRRFMDEQQFWPDAWSISDHGNAHRIDLS
jgi:hypothetical protein